MNPTNRNVAKPFDTAGELETLGTSGPDTSPATITLVRSIDRLCELLDRETAALQARQPADLDEFNDRKNQALLELSRLAREFNSSKIGSHLADRLRTLRDRLEVNRSVLRTHIDAVQEVSTIVSGAIREADSDGTYSALRQPLGTAA